MAKYRRKVLEVEVEAVRFNPPMDVSFLGDRFISRPMLTYGYSFDFGNGDRVTIDVGDYFIKDIEGHWYPCKKSVFEKCYEPITEGEK